jgi:diguanylate cyclase (GGDEF)-like protein/PAS domain S-box-containing protein
MEKRLKKDNYFLEEEIPESDLVVGQGEMSEQSRIISMQFERVLDSLPFYVLLVDSNHNIQFANNAFRKTFKVTLSEVQGAYCPRFVHKCDHYAGCAVDQAIREGGVEKIHFNQERGRWLITTAYPTGAKTKEGLELYYHSVRDITEERIAQEALKASESRYRGLFEEMKDVIFAMSCDGTLQDMNPAGLELLQIQQHRLMHMNLFVDLNLDALRCESFINTLKTKGCIFDYEITFVRPDGKTIIGSINATMEKNEMNDGTIRGIMRDLTRHRELEELSTIDVLTGLYNRGFFQTFLINRVRNMRIGQDSLSLLFFDIDNFKSYNDMFGHLEGDYVLKKVADAIKAAIRAEDVPCRYGGEEFSVILTCDAALAIVIAERVRRTIEDSCSDFANKDIKRGITVSIGTATLGADGADSAEKLVKVADIRMYEAKKKGKNQVFSG